jgi:hypothetical protein
LYAGEPFVEPLRSTLQQKIASKKQQVTEKAWRNASLMKQSSCPGLLQKSTITYSQQSEVACSMLQ